jgi:hypothetical protein
MQTRRRRRWRRWPTVCIIHPSFIYIQWKGFHFSEDDRKRALVRDDSMEVDLNTIGNLMRRSTTSSFLLFQFSGCQCLQSCSPDRGLGRVLIYSSPFFPVETPFSDYQISPRLDVTFDHYSLDSRDLTTPPETQDIHPDARWFTSSLLCAYSVVSIFHILIRSC